MGAPVPARQARAVTAIAARATPKPCSHCSKDIAMTKTLTPSPSDTGEHRLIADPGQVTTDLTPFQTTALINAPTFRRPDATGEIPVYDPHTFAVVGDLAETTSTRPAAPPQPQPAPPPHVDLYAVQPIAPLERVLVDADVPSSRRSVLYVNTAPRRPFCYAGRHRPGWHGKVRRFLADAIAPLVRAA